MSSEAFSDAGAAAAGASRRDAAPRAPAVRDALVLAAAVLLWTLPFISLGGEWVFAAFAAGALGVTGLLVWRYGLRLRQQLRPRPRDLLLGLVSGALMTALTYPLYRVARDLLPALGPAVRDAYAVSLPSVPLAVAVPWILFILSVEELLWRGLVVDVLQRRDEAPERRGRRWLVALAALSAYALVHLATGSWVVLILALGCGAVWLLLRLATGRLVAPLVSHALWSPTVLLLLPLEGA